MKKQVFIIHGGDTFDSYKEYLAFLKGWKIDFKRYQKKGVGWKKNLEGKLGRSYEVILPDMPNKINAKYLEWKIWFRKFIPYIRPNVILVGGSLGGIFLAKYLSENKFPKKIKATFLVAAPFDMEGTGESLADFKLPKSLARLKKQGGKIFVYHSRDDRVVPFRDSEKYMKSLGDVSRRIFTDRGHFNQESLPEIVKDIRAIK